MADLQPLLTLRYDPSVVGSLEDVIAPPYDVIDAELRARLAARRPYNVVEIDLPPSYEAAAATMADWGGRPARAAAGRRPRPWRTGRAAASSCAGATGRCASSARISGPPTGPAARGPAC